MVCGPIQNCVPGYDDLPRAERFARAAEMRENRATQEDVWNRLPAEVLNEAEGQYADLVKKLRETSKNAPMTSKGTAFWWALKRDWKITARPCVRKSASWTF